MAAQVHLGLVCPYVGNLAAGRIDLNVYFYEVKARFGDRLPLLGLELVLQPAGHVVVYAGPRVLAGTELDALLGGGAARLAGRPGDEAVDVRGGGGVDPRRGRAVGAGRGEVCGDGQPDRRRRQQYALSRHSNVSRAVSRRTTGPRQPNQGCISVAHVPLCRSSRSIASLTAPAPPSRRVTYRATRLTAGTAL